jgi:hypothetical protein
MARYIENVSEETRVPTGEFEDFDVRHSF